MATQKMVYYFGKKKTEGKGKSKILLGGKGTNLAEMTSIGLPVPPGFTITTEVCDSFYKSGEKLPSGLMDQVNKAVVLLEKELGKKFGDDANPLLVSVRSGAAVSMPGMMNTILNLLPWSGPTARVLAVLPEISANEILQSLVPGIGTSALK